MTYKSINYNALKNYIYDNKDFYNVIDILYLLEMGYINQQQYEDLVTVVTPAMYNYHSFLEQDKGYYRQQGPLNRIQIMNDILN